MFSGRGRQPPTRILARRITTKTHGLASSAPSARTAALEMHTTTINPSGRRLTWRRTGIVTSLMITVLAGAGLLIPAVVNHTSWRNGLLNQALQPHGLQATAARSSGGWLTPFEFYQVVVKDEQGQTCCRIDRLQSDQTILSHLSGDAVRTSIILHHPQFDIALDDNGRLPLHATGDSEHGSVRFQMTNAELLLRVPWRKRPLLDLMALDVQGTIISDTDGRQLSVDEFDLLRETALSPEHSEQNLALVAPLISQTTALHGSVSAHLQPIHIDLDQEFAADQKLLQGTVQIHTLEARLKPHWSRSIARLTPSMLPSAVPDQLQIRSSTSIDFCVTPQGIHHTGCELVLPEIGSGLRVASSGVLRLDEQVDLTLSVRIPPVETRVAPLFSAVARLFQLPMQLRVTGSVSAPQIMTAAGSPVLQEVTQNRDSAPTNPAEPGSQPATDSIRPAAADDRATSSAEQRPPRIFRLLQSSDSTDSESASGSESLSD